jgi:hypothetical protein
MYVIYGVQIEAKVEWEAGEDKNPVVYSINGHTLCDDEDFMGNLEDMADDPDVIVAPGAEKFVDIEFYNGVPTEYHGANDMKKAKFIMRVLGHSGQYGCGDMGARHFTEGFGKKVGKKGKALIGYVAGCQSYWNGAEEIAPVDQIHTQATRLIAEIKEKLGLEIKKEQLGLHLLFDSLNGY